MWSAAILVGGQARRFAGRDKGTLLVDGRPILDRQIDELSKVTKDILIVGSAAVRSPRARAVPDAVPGCGPLGGLKTALDESAGTATIVVACDMPHVSAPFVEHLLALTDGADAVVPR